MATQRKPRIEVETGWWVPLTGAPRDVLAIGNGYVLYNDGRGQRECQLRSFKRWVRETGAKGDRQACIQPALELRS